MPPLDDATFLSMIRAPEEGGVNPGRALLSEDLAFRAGDTGDMRDNLAILYGIVRGMRAREVLEIGVNDGTSTLALLKAVSEVDGHLTSIDMQETPVAEALVHRFGLGPRWTLFRDSSHVALPKMVQENRQFDVILIDGDHSEEGAETDLLHCEKMLASNGIVLTHDNWFMASDVDLTRPFGERAQRGCGLLGKSMMAGSFWVGVIFTFGCQMGVWRRRSDVLRELDSQYNDAKEKGYLK